MKNFSSAQPPDHGDCACGKCGHHHQTDTGSLSADHGEDRETSRSSPAASPCGCNEQDGHSHDHEHCGHSRDAASPCGRPDRGRGEPCREHKHDHKHGGGHDHDGCSCTDFSKKLEDERSFNLFSVHNILFALGLVLFVFACIFRTENFYIELFKFLAIYLLLGYRILWSCLKNILRGKIFDENVLMLLAGVGAFILGDYIEGCAIVIFFTVGEAFQDFAVTRSADKIKNALAIIPSDAFLVNGETVTKVKTASLEVGNVIEVKVGERIPVDCELLSERAYFDTSALTGETNPREIQAGGETLSGYINTQTVIRLKVLRRLSDSAATQIIDMVKEATENKSASENFITTFAKFYTPIVAILAVLIAVLFPFAFGFTFARAFKIALTFLLISCPCALVISIPLSFFNGLGKSAKEGVLIKGSNYLNTLAKADTFLFDKTGTLTDTDFTIDGVVATGGFTQDEVLDKIAALEFYSNHPLAKAVTKDREKPPIVLSDIREEAGLGVFATCGNEELFAGKCKELARLDKTSVGLKINGTLAGYITLSAKVLSGTKEGLKILNACGVKRVAMLTGDNTAAAEKIAHDLGIGEVYSRMTPKEKLERVTAVTAQHPGKTAYVGDGINDVPSLARADLGISASSVQDAAINAADIVLTRPGILSLARAKRSANRTRKKVFINIVFALAVKVAVLTLSFIFPLPLFAAVLADVGCALITVLFSVLF